MIVDLWQRLANINTTWISKWRWVYFKLTRALVSLFCFYNFWLMKRKMQWRDNQESLCSAENVWIEYKITEGGQEYIYELSIHHPQCLSKHVDFDIISAVRFKIRPNQVFFFFMWNILEMTLDQTCVRNIGLWVFHLVVQ